MTVDVSWAAPEVLTHLMHSTQPLQAMSWGGTVCYTALTCKAMLLPLQTLPDDFVLRGPLVIAGVKADYVVGLEGLAIGVTSCELSSGHWHYRLPFDSYASSWLLRCLSTAAFCGAHCSQKVEHKHGKLCEASCSWPSCCHTVYDAIV